MNGNEITWPRKEHFYKKKKKQFQCAIIECSHTLKTFPGTKCNWISEGWMDGWKGGRTKRWMGGKMNG